MHRRAPRFLPSASLLGLGLAAALALPSSNLAAEGGGPSLPPPPVAPAAPAPGQAAALRLFDESVRWVARGAQGITQVQDFYVALDAKFQLDTTSSEGPMRLWLQQPDKFRQEMTISNAPQTKILDGTNLWIAGQDGRFKNMNKTADGAGAVAQANEDRERLVDITTFLTMQGLKGPGVTFEYLGETNPSGDYQRQDIPGQPSGTWAKIVRKATGRPNITFWLAHTTDAQGVMRATYPGVVRVDGEPQNNIPTEDYILQDWNDRPGDPPRPFRFPRRIRAFQIRPGQAPVNFLQAILTDIKINQGIDPSRFAPPR